MKTKLRYVGLKDRHLVVSESPLSPEQAKHAIKLRTISESAAIRHYIKKAARKEYPPPPAKIGTANNGLASINAWNNFLC